MPISKNRSWNELTSKEQTELLLQALGPQTKYGDKKVLIPTVFYSTVSFLGFPGNLLTCLTICKNAYMKTAANWLIFNLAITDLVTLLLGIRNILVTYYYRLLYLYLFISPYHVSSFFNFSYSNGNHSILE